MASNTFSYERTLRFAACAILIGTTGIATSATYKILHSFGQGTDGAGIYAGVALGAQGKLYGVTSAGGAYGDGTAFELSRLPDGRWSEKVLYSFCAEPQCQDGAFPRVPVTIDITGNVLGAAFTGGPEGIGSIFQLTPGPGGWNFSVIHGSGSFGLVLDESGNLYGAVDQGKYSAGDIGELSPTPNGWTATELYSFCPDIPCRSGWGPQSALTWDSKGNLYGTTEFGGNTQPYCFGSAGCGVVFKLKNLGGGQWEYHVLHRFAAFPNDGQTPIGGVVVDKDGKVYGTTTQGGNGATLFRLTQRPDGTWKEKILYNFPDPVHNGGYPMSTLVFDQAGNLYGTATSGGDPVCDCGVIFKLTHQPTGKWTYSVLYKFTWATGAGPNGLTIDSKGHLYGTTAAGGKYNSGVAFKFVP